MPIYEYSCDGCGHQLEALQKISDPLLRTCPECGKDALRKRVSAASFRLKGGGWYETDFKDKGKKPAKAASGDEPASGGKDKAKENPDTTNKENKKKDENKGSDSGTGKDPNKSDKTATG